MQNFLDSIINTISLGWELLNLIVALAMIGIPLGLWIIEEHKAFHEFRKWVLNLNLKTRYKKAVIWLLRRANEFYGPTQGLSLHGFSACFRLALVYPLAFWLLAWSLGGPGDIGAGSLGHDTPPWLRIVFLVGLLSLVLVFGLWFRYSGKFKLRSIVSTNSSYQAHNRSPRFSFAIRALIAGVVFCLFGGLGAAAGIAIQGAENSLSSLGVYVAIGAGGAGVIGIAMGTFAASIVGVLIGAAIVVGVFSTGNAITGAIPYLVLLILLPIANAALDHLSVQASRCLLRRLVVVGINRRSALLHLASDALLALLFLVCLVILLPISLQAANHFFVRIEGSTFEWQIYLENAQNHPFGSGLFVVGMLATTLVPTLIHLTAGAIALLLPDMGGRWLMKLGADHEPSRLVKIGFSGVAVFSVILPLSVLGFVGIVVVQGAELWLPAIGSSLFELAKLAASWVPNPSHLQ